MTNSIRKYMTAMLLVSTFLFIAGASAIAQDDAMMFAPPPPEVQKIYRFIGEWHGDGEATMGDMSTPVHVTLTAEKDAGGWGVHAHMTAEMGNAGTYQEIDIMGYEPNSKTYHLFSVTNMGDTHDHSGTWDGSGKTLNLTYKGLYQGQPMVETIACIFNGSDEMEITSKTTVGGQQMGLFIVTLHK
jgi:hypothetical protein